MALADHAIELAHPPEAARAALERAAGLWGAELEPRGADRFHLRLAAAAGLRRGWETGEVAIEPAATGALVSFRPEASEYRLQTAPVGILVLAALGGIAAVLWPFVPALTPLAPIGVVLGLAAWFLVLSRLHTSGPAEFLETVAEAAAGKAEDAG